MTSFRTHSDAWLRLLRLPNLFTVPGDPLAGFILASASGTNRELYTVLPCLTASMMLYAAGLIMNDYFDLEEDCRERPDRPLPSGRIAPQGALKTALILILTGIGAAGLAGERAALIAFFTAVAIIIYDIKMKMLPWWRFLNMGCCRGLSLLLGAAAAAPAEFYLHKQVMISAAGLTLYIACVSQIAARETEKIRIGKIRWSPFIVLLIWFPHLFISVQPMESSLIAISSLLAIIALIHTRYWTRILAGMAAPSQVSQTVGALLRGLLLIQASLCALNTRPGRPAAGVLLVGWFISFRLSRRFYAS